MFLGKLLPAILVYTNLPNSYSGSTDTSNTTDCVSESVAEPVTLNIDMSPIIEGDGNEVNITVNVGAINEIEEESRSTNESSLSCNI
jgi:hypothetical protein